MTNLPQDTLSGPGFPCADSAANTSKSCPATGAGFMAGARRGGARRSHLSKESSLLNIHGKDVNQKIPESRNRVAELYDGFSPAMTWAQVRALTGLARPAINAAAAAALHAAGFDGAKAEAVLAARGVQFRMGAWTILLEKPVGHSILRVRRAAEPIKAGHWDAAKARHRKAVNQ